MPLLLHSMFAIGERAEFAAVFSSCVPCWVGTKEATCTACFVARGSQAATQHCKTLLASHTPPSYVANFKAREWNSLLLVSRLRGSPEL